MIRVQMTLQVTVGRDARRQSDRDLIFDALLEIERRATKISKHNVMSTVLL